MIPGTKSRGRCVRQPCRRLVEAGNLAALDPVEESGPSFHLAVVVAVGPAEVTESLGLPVHLSHLDDPVDELVGQTPTFLRVGVVGGCPAVERHGRPSIDKAHDVERAVRERVASRHTAIASVCGTSVSDSASMMRHSRRMPSSRAAGAERGGMRSAPWRSPRRTSKISFWLPPEMKAASKGRPTPGQPLVVHPRGE